MEPHRSLCSMGVGAKAAQQIYPRPVGVGGGCGGSIQQDLKSIWETAKDGEGALPLRPGEILRPREAGKGKRPSAVAEVANNLCWEIIY